MRVCSCYTTEGRDGAVVVVEDCSCDWMLTTDVCCVLLDVKLPERPFAAVRSRSAHSCNIFSMLWAKIFDSQTTRFASASQGKRLAGVCGASMDAKDWTD